MSSAARRRVPVGFKHGETTVRHFSGSLEGFLYFNMLKVYLSSRGTRLSTRACSYL